MSITSAQQTNNFLITGKIKLQILQFIKNATSSEAVKLETLEKHISVKESKLPITQYLDSLSLEGFVHSTRRRKDDITTHWYWPTPKGIQATPETFGLSSTTFNMINDATQSTQTLEFSIVDKALIKKVHDYMPAQQLLSLLNERLQADKGPDTPLYTMAMLYDEIAKYASINQKPNNDWGHLRKLIAKAQREGVLDLITEQTIDDFAIVYSLTHKQLLLLKDIILQAKED